MNFAYAARVADWTSVADPGEMNFAYARDDFHYGDHEGVSAWDTSPTNSPPQTPAHRPPQPPARPPRPPRAAAEA
eukprot:1050569-Prorocentrum_minimum.AAC.1